MGSTSRGMIFYAEDDFHLRAVIGGSLRNMFPDFDLETFEDGTSLDGRLKSGDLEVLRLVITDDHMPGINGNGLIRKYASKINVPFVLFYGGDFGKIGEQALRDGALKYIRKESGVSELFNYVESILVQ